MTTPITQAQAIELAAAYRDYMAAVEAMRQLRYGMALGEREVHSFYSNPVVAGITLPMTPNEIESRLAIEISKRAEQVRLAGGDVATLPPIEPIPLPSKSVRL